MSSQLYYSVIDPTVVYNFNKPISTSKYYIPGYGYSNNSGPPSGGLSVNASPLHYSSTFYGSDVKSLLPNGTLSFNFDFKK